MPIASVVRPVQALVGWKDVPSVGRMLPQGNNFLAHLAESQHRALVSRAAGYRVSDRGTRLIPPARGDDRMSYLLRLSLVTLLSGAAGGCCCLRQRCPEPCPPPCPAPVCPDPCAPACPTPFVPGAGAPPIGAPTYAPVAPLSMQGSNTRPELAGSRGTSAPARGPASTVMDTLRSWAVWPVSGPTRANPTVPAARAPSAGSVARPLALLQ
jgi:hypothetical protein